MPDCVLATGTAGETEVVADEVSGGGARGVLVIVGSDGVGTGGVGTGTTSGVVTIATGGVKASATTGPRGDATTVGISVIGGWPRASRAKFLRVSESSGTSTTRTRAVPLRIDGPGGREDGRGVG